MGDDMADNKKGSRSGSGAKKSASPGNGSNKGKSKSGAAAVSTGISSKSMAPPKRKNQLLRDQIWAIIIICTGIFIAVSIQTDTTGQFGLILRAALKGCFGLAAYVMPYYLIVYGLLLLSKQTAHISGRTVFLLFMIFMCIVVLNASRFVVLNTNEFSLAFISDSFKGGQELVGGGSVGMVIGYFLEKYFGITGLYLVCAAILAICLLMLMNTPFAKFLETRKQKKLDKLERDFYAGEEAAKAEAEAEKEREIANAVSGKKVTDKPCFKGAIASKKITETGIFNEGQSTPVFPNAEIYLNSPVPVVTPDLEGSRRQIIDYMKDDSDFGISSADALYESVLDEDIGNNINEVDDTDEDINIVDISEIWDPSADNDAGIATEKSVIKKAPAGDPATIIPEETPVKSYKLPPISLLKRVKPPVNRGEELALKAQAAKLETVLHDFGVNARVVDVKKGAAVTRYEIQPATGVKVSSIVRLADDIALNLEARSIRIEAPIPGKAAVGIEVENNNSAMVSLREMIESDEFQKAESKISFVVGKDISGNAVVANLKSMPHLLIAGSTGSGKSVCINSLLMSMLYKSKPDEVKFVLVDPKVVELGNYNGIPHMLIPVVTDPSKAAAALGWAVQEMNDRYKKFAEASVRDLASFNDKMRVSEPDRVMPQIVIIIDELADLMMVAPSQVEEYICRLAQMARAAGMHLILATQRPSVDIITGVIKANIPSRIAFAVSSGIDSRTILDMVGAERLVGKGDMLFNPLGMPKPVRLQGPFVSDDEVNSVIAFWKNQVTEVEYATDVMSHIDKVKLDDSAGGDEDDLLDEAIGVVVSAEQASASMLQRRFRIGYNRAARLIDIMEARGIIGASEGSKPRKVFLAKEDWEENAAGIESAAYDNSGE
jgi:DNA segregation ATPase FtsK/SpoIIIE, S-DNA-T family